MKRCASCSRRVAVPVRASDALTINLHLFLQCAATVPSLPTTSHASTSPLFMVLPAASPTANAFAVSGNVNETINRCTSICVRSDLKGRMTGLLPLPDSGNWISWRGAILRANQQSSCKNSSNRIEESPTFKRPHLPGGLPNQLSKL
jgi:hypothetical protein